MRKLMLMLAIFTALSACKKEPVATPEPVPATAQSKLFVVDLQSSEPTGPMFGYVLYVNGTDIASPATVNAGDSVRVVVFNPLGNSFILKCNLDNVNVYPNGNYQYADVDWSYVVQ